MKIPALFFVLIIFCSTVLAQQKPEDGYLKSYLIDTRDLLVQPTKWKGQEWLIFGGAAVTFTGIYLVDDDIQIAFQNSRTETSNWISTYVAEPIGSGLYTLPALGVLYGMGWINDNPKNRYVALKGAEAWLLTGAATLVLKQLAHRQRPNEGAFPDPNYWLGPYAFTSDNTSFPSGHTSTAFAVAAVVAGSYNSAWIKGLSYGMASLAGLSRIHDNKHWASDVFVGALLGWWIGHSLISHSSNLQWGASISGNHYSGSLVWRF